MSEEIQRSLLGSIVLSRGALLDGSDIGDTDFSEGKYRDAFRKAVKLKEDRGTIDPVLLAESIGGLDGALFIADLLGGMIELKPEIFRDRLAELRSRRLSTEIVRVGQELASDHLKRGDFDEEKLAQLRRLIQKQDELTQAGTRQDPARALLSGAQLQALDVRIEWTVDKLIPSRSLTLLHGPGGLGKTWLALCLSKAVSEGAPFLGLPTQKRPVVYIDYENPLPLLIERVRQLAIADVRFWHLSADPRPPKLDSDDWVRYKALPAGSLIVFDTVRAAHDGDENSSQDAGLVMGRLKELRELGNDVLLLHHVPKADERQYKGATTWSDLADHVLAFHKVRRETLEELDEGGFDPQALLALGTGSKTRFEPCRLYLTLDPEAGGFKLALDPKLETMRAIADYIAGQGAGSNQGEIISWAKEAGIGPKRRNSFIALLAKGAKEGRWKAVPGFRGAKVYEPPTCT